MPDRPRWRGRSTPIRALDSGLHDSEILVSRTPDQLLKAQWIRYKAVRTVGKRLKITVRPRDHLVRLGGGEFVVILEHVSGPDDVEHVASRLLAAFRDGFHLQQSTHVLSASIGIGLYPEHGDDAETLLKHADIAMYSVKTEGKGAYRFFQARYFEAIRTRLEMEMELRLALDEHQFIVH